MASFRHVILLTSSWSWGDLRADFGLAMQAGGPPIQKNAGKLGNLWQGKTETLNNIPKCLQTDDFFWGFIPCCKLALKRQLWCSPSKKRHFSKRLNYLTNNAHVHIFFCRANRCGIMFCGPKHFGPSKPRSNNMVDRSTQSKISDSISRPADQQIEFNLKDALFPGAPKSIALHVAVKQSCWLLGFDQIGSEKCVA